MPVTTSAPPRVIVIPRQLEAFFYERLTSEFIERTRQPSYAVVPFRPRPGSVEVVERLA